MFKKLFALFVLLLAILNGYAQQSKDGARIINTSGAIINEYTFLTANAAAGAGSLTVASAGLNSSGRFSGVLTTGDLILIIQMQGASINSSSDSTWGSVSAYNNAGNYEFAEVVSVSGKNILTSCPLQYSYSAAGKVQVIRVPRYSTLTISAGSSVVAQPWDGSIGGVLVAESAGNITINGIMDVSALGFRGGAIDNGAGGGYTGFANTDSTYGAEKGEGIAGYKNDYNAYGGRYGRGAPANGGGGGNSHNAPGGGGGNAGADAYTGNGNPDVTTNASWISAWNVEYPGFANSISSGGGRGGCSLSEKDADALTYAPGDWYYWRGDGRQSTGGKGGRPMDYSSGRIFMGGGGGAGDANGDEGGRGGRGGGLIFLTSCGAISGTGKIIANGEAAPDITSFSSGDAVGGGGAGGTIILNAKSGASGISLVADGGKGADHIFNNGGIAYGPGGGGGGGYIAITSGTVSRSAKGGVNGITTSNAFSEFPPNSATKGGKGIDNAIFKLPVLTAHDTTICPGNPATLKATYAGGAINWYKTSSRNSYISTGPTLTTGPLFKDSVFYVGSCFTYCPTPLIPVTVKVTGSSGKYAGNDITVCSGIAATIGLASVASYSYQWTPATNLSNANTAQPVFKSINKTSNPVDYIFYLTAGTASCKSIDTVKVTVNPEPTAFAGNDITVCSGNVAQLGEAQKAGYNYSWSPATKLTSSAISNPVFSDVNAGAIPITTQIILTVTQNSCIAKDTVLITVTNGAGSTEAGADQSVCSGTDVMIGVAPVNGTTYSWAPVAGLDNSTRANPVLRAINNSNTSVIKKYYLTADLNGCKSTDSVLIEVKPIPSVFAGRDTSVCAGAPVQLGSSAIAGVTYLWSPVTGLNSNAIANPLLKTINNSGFPVSETYIVNANLNGCSKNDSVTIIVKPIPSITAGRDTSVCAGAKVLLGSPSLTGVVYNWTPAVGLNDADISNPELTSINSGNSSTSNLYVVTGNLNGCIKKDSVVVITNPIPIAIAGPDATVCSGEAVNIGDPANAQYQYFWTPAIAGNPAQSVLIFMNGTQAPKSYRYIIKTSANACSNSDTIDIVIKPIHVASAGNDIVICSGEKIEIGAASVNNVSYSWSPVSGLSNGNISNPLISVVNATQSSQTYQYILNAELNGCSSQDTIDVTVNPGPVADAGNDTSVCSGESGTLGASAVPGYQYSWIPAVPGNPSLFSEQFSNTASADKQFTYIVIARYLSCADSDTVIITAKPIPDADAGPSSLDVCSGTSMELGVSPSGSVQYSWSPAIDLSVPTISNPVLRPHNMTDSIVSINYVLTATLNGCFKKDSILVNVKPLPLVSAGNDTSACDSLSLLLSTPQGPGYVYQWIPQTFLDNPTSATPYLSLKNKSDKKQIYKYTVNVSSDGCSQSDSVVLSLYPKPRASNDTIVCYGETILLTANGGSNYLWSTGDTSSIITINVTNTKTYHVTINGVCQGTDSVNVVLKNENPNGLYIPNAFSPDGDGLNEVFKVEGDPAVTFSASIFNRWGECVYSWDNMNASWDGKANGQVFQEEVYSYIIKARQECSSARIYSGAITILK